MKVAIFGVSGQLGRDVAAALSDVDAVPLDHARVDVRDAPATMGAIRTLRPDWVIGRASCRERVCYVV